MRILNVNLFFKKKKIVLIELLGVLEHIVCTNYIIINRTVMPLSGNSVKKIATAMRSVIGTLDAKNSF